MQNSIFRKVALERLSSPDQLDQLMQVTSRRGWLALTALIALLAMAVFWGFFGTVSTRITAHGILVNSGGLRGVLSSQSGQVMDIQVSRGEMISRGEVVASLLHSVPRVGDQITYVSSPHDGRVVEVLMVEGDYVQQGARILSVEPSDARLEAVVYAPLAEGKKVQPTMEVEIALSTVRPEEYGYMLGRVISVSEFPVTEQGMVRVLGAPELASQFSMGGRPYEIVVQLLRDPDSGTGFLWSSQGPDIGIESGTACSVRIVTERRRPITLVIPFLKRTLGTY